MRKTLSLMIAILFAGLAGCIGADDAPKTTTTDDGPPEDTAAILAAGAHGLGCEADWTKSQTSPFFEDIGEHVNEDARFGEAEAIDGTDLVLFAHYGGGGFTMLNVTDPYDPEVVTETALESYSLDIKVSTDGQTLFSGDFGRLELVDISDPYTPASIGFVDYPIEAQMTSAQAHMIHVAEIDGQDYVFAASQWGQGVLVYRLTGDDPAERDLEFLTYFAPAIGGPLAAHDMMVQHDPVEDKPILWVANGFGGFIAADVSDPAMPVPVSYTPEADPYQGYTHTISVTEYDGTRYAVTMAELGAMALKVYDVTTLAAPVLLGTWTIEEIPLSTQHNTQILGDWLWLGHYGEGVVFFDLNATVQDLGPAPAYNIGPLSAIAPHGQYAPEGSTWESIVVDGVHYTTTGSTVHITLNGCLPAGDEDADAYV